MNDSNITIRSSQKKDLAEMQTLFLETISAICKDDYTPQQITVWISSVENMQRWTDKLETQYFLIAQTGPKIIGYASLENNDYLDFMYVHKDFQRKGIANRLYAEIEGEAVRRGATILQSDVSITARPFFEKKGFKVVLEQKIIMKGVEILNYNMRKELITT